MRLTNITDDFGMQPLRTCETDAWLNDIRLTFREATSNSASTTLGIPVAAEDNACISMWAPTWRERLRLAFGVPVRVLLNYSPHAPLYVDTEGWAASSRD
jgi:hypothetical protein